MRMLGCLLLLACVSAQAGDEVYKWVDADGRVQYGNNPPKGVNAKPVAGGVTVVPALKMPARAQESAPASAREIEAAPAAPAASSASASSAMSPEELKRRRLIADCERNRGVDCEAEVDARLSGAPGTVFVPVPGWSQPPIRPNRSAASSAHASSRVRGNEPPRAASAPGKRGDAAR